jgi:hypothetical protein
VLCCEAHERLSEVHGEREALESGRRLSDAGANVAPATADAALVRLSEVFLE